MENETILHITSKNQNKSMISHQSKWNNISFDNMSNPSLMKMQNAMTTIKRNLVTSREIAYATIT